MTPQDFAAAMKYIAAGIGKELTKESLRVYFDSLQDLPAEALMVAAKRAVLESEYHVFPTVAQLRKLAVESMQPPAMLAMEAWGLVQQAVVRYGYYKQQQALASLPEPVRTVAERFGFQTFCDSSSQEILRAQFVKAFDAEQTHRRERALLPEAVRLAQAQLALQHYEKLLERNTSEPQTTRRPRRAGARIDDGPVPLGDVLPMVDRPQKKPAS
jgi:hypothetical protein